MDKEKRDTFEFLYKTHYKELYVHALSFVRDEEEAKDIVTDVYEYVWKNFEKLDSSVSLRPFLYSLVRSRSLDFLRKEKTKEKFLAYKKTFPEEEEEYVEYEQLIEKVMHILKICLNRLLSCSKNVSSSGKNTRRRGMNWEFRLTRFGGI